MRLLNTKDGVKELLEEHPELRDDDNKLIAGIWYAETEAISLSKFFTELAESKLTSPESIRRCRQKLQEENEALRGNNYVKRHKHQEEVIKELREPVWSPQGQIKGQKELF